MRNSLLEKKKVGELVKMVETTVETVLMSQKIILGNLRNDNIEIKELDIRTLITERGFREAQGVDRYTSKRPIILNSKDLMAYESQEIPFSCGANGLPTLMTRRASALSTLTPISRRTVSRLKIR